MNAYFLLADLGSGFLISFLGFLFFLSFFWLLLPFPTILLLLQVDGAWRADVNFRPAYHIPSE